MPLLADAAPAAQPVQPGIADLIRSPMVPVLIAMFGFLYVTNRMQKKKVREHEDRVKMLKSGDRVVTNGGILGTIISVKEKSVSIRSADSKMEITKSAIAEILERSAEPSES